MISKKTVGSLFGEPYFAGQLYFQYMDPMGNVFEKQSRFGEDCVALSKRSTSLLVVSFVLIFTLKDWGRFLQNSFDEHLFFN